MNLIHKTKIASLSQSVVGTPSQKKKHTNTDTYNENRSR